jgi:MFS family permease
MLVHPLDQAGRKSSLIGGLLLFSMGSLLNIDCGYAWLFLLGRLVVGFGSGMIVVASPCLIAEVSPSDLRGCLVGFFTLLTMAGQLAGYYMMLEIGPNVSTSSIHRHRRNYDWRVAVGLETCLCMLLILIQWQLPESPRWLAIEKDDEGLQVIAYLQELPQDDPGVQQQWKQIKTSPHHDNDGMLGYSDLVRRTTPQRKRQWLVACVLMVANQVTGCDTLLKYYASAIFYASGLQASNPFVATGCTQSLALAATAISLGWCVDHVGRKTLLFVGSLVLAMCYLGLAGVFQWFSIVDWQTGSLFLMDANARMVAVACVYIFIIAYAFTWGSVILTTSCELFVTVDRAKGLALLACLMWASRWLLIISSLWCFALSPALVYWIHGGVMLGSCYFVYCWVPNTTKQSLEKIAEMLL